MPLTAYIDETAVADAIASGDLDLMEILVSAFHENEPIHVLNKCDDNMSGSIAEVSIAPHLRALADLIEAD